MPRRPTACFCTGSLGVRADNDLPAIARRFAPRIHFAHLRATTRSGDGRSFHESAHLEGDVPMVDVLKELVAEDRNRGSGETIVFRSDHGHRMLDDLAKTVTPGYPAIGRLRGLAELRGILHAPRRGPELIRPFAHGISYGTTSAGALVQRPVFPACHLRGCGSLSPSLHTILTCDYASLRFSVR